MIQANNSAKVLAESLKDQKGVQTMDEFLASNF